MLLFGALSPAVSSFIFAQCYQQEADKVASIVMIGNACALLFVPLAPALRLYAQPCHLCQTLVRALPMVHMGLLDYSG
jgi:hypothetical protein